eukprot:gene24040-29091_t
MSEMTEEEQLSALQENITRKGANSYYYAHGKKIEGPQWDGREEPRLLGTVPAEVVKTKTVLVNTLDSFSWLDETKHVKVYVEHESAGTIDDTDIGLESDETSFSFKFVQDSKPYCLTIGPLYSDIEGATYIKKSDKFVIKLKKKSEGSWYQLKKNA